MAESKWSHLPAIVRGVQRRVLLPAMLLASSSVLLLSGCSSALFTGTKDSTGTTEVAGVSGRVHGGQSPVVGSTIQIYAVPNGPHGLGYGAAANPVGSSVMSNSGGSFTYGAFTCTNATDELYIVATGGNAGGNTGSGGSNSYLAMTAPLGPCSGVVSGGASVNIDEVTTVATEYSLAGFSASTGSTPLYTHVGTSTTTAGQTGLTNAFATISNLVNVSTGMANVVTPGYTSTQPTNTSPDLYHVILPNDVINTLANVLANCVNTDGTGTQCSNLSTATGNSTNTADAVLYIAQNPGTNVSTIYGLSTAYAQFNPALSAAPNDWTLTVNFLAGGLGGINSTSNSNSDLLAIDSQGNIWVSNPNAAGHPSITILDNLGVPIFGSATPTVNLTATGAHGVHTYPLLTNPGIEGGGLAEPNQIAIDGFGNAWIADYNSGLVAFNSSGGILSGSPFSSAFTGAGIAASTGSITVDINNNVWVGGSGSAETYITAFGTSSGTTAAILSGFPTQQGVVTGVKSMIGPDYSGLVWYEDDNGNWNGYNTSGSAVRESATAGNETLSAPGYTAMGTTPGGSLGFWTPQGDGTEDVQPVLIYTATTTEFGILPGAYTPTSEASPGAVAIDGNGRVYFPNSTTPGNLTVFSKSGTLLSPSIGYYGAAQASTNNFTALSTPIGIGIDQSGNVWVVNTADANSTANSAYWLTPSNKYLGEGVGSSNLTEFIGLAAPVNPVFSASATNGTYGTKP